MSHKGEPSFVQEVSIEAKERLLSAVSLFGVTNSCGSRCEMFNPAYDFADPKVQQCYSKCVSIYRDLRRSFESN